MGNSYKRSVLVSKLQDFQLYQQCFQLYFRLDTEAMSELPTTIQPTSSSSVAELDGMFVPSLSSTPRGKNCVDGSAYGSPPLRKRKAASEQVSSDEKPQEATPSDTR